MKEYPNNRLLKIQNQFSNVASIKNLFNRLKNWEKIKVSSEKNNNLFVLSLRNRFIGNSSTRVDRKHVKKSKFNDKYFQ
tara:strand:+ start:390 stop:626 length:237 start_codon:yes stop_codon:yes gene_type:complete